MAPSTLSTYISAVAFCHKLNGWSDPSQSFIVQKLKEGCRRSNRKSDIRRPVTLDLLGRLCHIVACIVKSEHEAALFRSAFLLAFFGFFRVGEITASSKSADCSRILGLSDVRFEGHDQSTMIIKLRFSKTDQQGNSASLRFRRNPNSQLCPLRCLSQYLSMRPPVGDCLFVHADGSPLTAYQFRHILKKGLEALGVPTLGFSGHSFRIGAATSAALNGLSIPVVQSLDRWKSSAVNWYIRPNKV